MGEPINLYGSFRCGLAHAVSPKSKITLSSKGELGHLVIDEKGRLNLKIEDFYVDFKSACEFVIAKEFEDNNKMNQDFIEVPGTTFDSGTNIVTGSTSSLIN